MRSNAGHYIGTSFTDPNNGDYGGPHERLSGYFKTREKAQTCLDENIEHYKKKASQ